jgi:hypothetical protein
MKRVIAIFFFLSLFLFGKAQEKMEDAPKVVSTIGVFDTNEAKSGYLINGYYVEMTNAEFKKYKGKKVRVSGKLAIAKGLSSEDMKHEQGSSEDRKFIIQYRIKILK